MCIPHFFAFALSAGACVLLALITFSVPFVSSFYFLHSDVAGGVKYGVWGWCLDNGLECSGPKTIGYHWDPQIIPWLTDTLALFPVAAGITALSVLSMIPTFCSYRDRYYPPPMFAFFSVFAFISSFFGTVFMFALFTIALHRFHDDGIGASLGPLPWMAVGATVALAIVALSSGCGGLCWGRYGRTSRYLAYNV